MKFAQILVVFIFTVVLASPSFADDEETPCPETKFNRLLANVADAPPEAVSKAEAERIERCQAEAEAKAEAEEKARLEAEAKAKAANTKPSAQERQQRLRELVGEMKPEAFTADGSPDVKVLNGMLNEGEIAFTAEERDQLWPGIKGEFTPPAAGK